MESIEKVFSTLKQKKFASFSLFMGIAFEFAFFLTGTIKNTFTFASLLNLFVFAAIWGGVYYSLANGKKDLFSAFVFMTFGYFTFGFPGEASALGNGTGAMKLYNIFSFIAWLFVFALIVLFLLEKLGALSIPKVKFVFDCAVLLAGVFFLAAAVAGFCTGKYAWYIGFDAFAYFSLMPLFMTSVSKL